MPLELTNQPPYYEIQGGATPTNLKSYKGLASQSGTAVATIVELQNTIGEIAWSRSGAGTTIGTLTGAFPANKTWSIISDNSGDELVQISINRLTNDTIRILTNSNGTPADDILNNTSFLITINP